MPKFEDVYPQIQRRVVKFVAKRTAAPSDEVDEIVCATMVAAWRGWHTFRSKSSYLTWVCRIALNKIADYYRQKVNRRSELVAPMIETLVEPGSVSHEEKIALEELKMSVSRWLELIPADKRRILELKYWDELTNEKISAVMGISTKAVESRLYRARKALASVVAKQPH